MGFYAELIRSATKRHVHSIQIGDTDQEDRVSGFTRDVNAQVEEVCRELKLDPLLKDGFDAIGFSQGSQFLRAYVQRCNDPPVRNLISIGGQHQGVFGLPHCDGLICDLIRRGINHLIYFEFIQTSLVQAQYWHDPLHPDSYREYNTFLADINNERHINETYVKNLLSLKNFVMVKFLRDTMVNPPETQWFGFYKNYDVDTVLPLRQTPLYLEDRLGLRAMDEAKKLQFLEIDAGHLQMPVEWFHEFIIKPYLLE